MSSVALVTPLHDPRGALVAEVEAVRADPAASAAWRGLRERLDTIVASASPGGAPKTRAALETLGFNVLPRDGGSEHWMWTLVDAALELDAEHYFLPDTDRLLHWLLCYPGELQDLPRRWGRHDVLALTRSARALASHPPTQALTEGPVNGLVGQLIDVPGADPFSGAYMVSRRALEAIRASDAPRDATFYVEAFLAPARAGCTFDRWVVEGLEWETPDLFRAEIAELGWERWLAGFQTAEQWEKRVRMMALWIDRLRVHRSLI